MKRSLAYLPQLKQDEVQLIGTRYDRHYKITKEQLEQLEYLGQRVKYLRQLTKKICKEKLQSFV